MENIDFSEIEKSTFFRVYNDKQQRDEIRITTTNFNQDEKNKIFEFCSEEGQAKIDNNQLQKKWIGGKAYCKGWGFVNEFTDKSHFAIAFTAFKNAEGRLQKELVLLYKENRDANWIQGINCNLRNILIQSAIIPAFRDPKDQLRINAYTWFGKLLKAYVTTDSKELNDAFKSVKDASDGLFKNLKEKVSEKEIDIAFPNTSISFQFNPDTKQDIHKSTLIYVNDGFNSELKDKGAGIQSAITISLFDFYVRNIAHSGSSLLAVEEPELYLHPHGRRVISDRLTRFVDKGKNQVIITTHSPEFISTAHETVNIISVRKDKTATTAKNIYFDTAKRKQILIKKQNAEMFFSDAVILAEGADKYFMEESARCLKEEIEISNSDGELLSLDENWMNDYNISVINCGGKAELWKYAEILKEVDIPFVITADFDFLRNGLSELYTKLKYDKKYSDSLNALKSKLSKDAKQIKQVGDEKIKEEVEKYIASLYTNSIFIFSGELEHFYKIKPSFDKEGGVIETMGKLIEEAKGITEYVDCSEYFNMLKVFLEQVMGFKIIERVAEAKAVENVN